MFPVGDSEIFWNLYEVFIFVLTYHSTIPDRLRRILYNGIPRRFQNSTIPYSLRRIIYNNVPRSGYGIVECIN